MRCSLVIVAGCAHAARPTVTGAELYAQVRTIQATGAATVGAIAVRKDQVLATGAQTFVVAQVIDNCRGGDASADVDCALALLVDQRFTVMDHLPQGGVKPEHEDQSRSIVSSAVVIGLGVAAVGGLVYGIAACEFPGCKYVFGVPLVFVGAGALFLISRD